MRKLAGLAVALVLLGAPLAASQGASANGGIIRVLGGEGVVSSEVFSHLSTCIDGDVVRSAGADRFATAAAVSQATYPSGSDVAFVATGLDFPDAVAAGSAAALAAAPILLVHQNSIPSATSAELTRLGVSTIFVVGGSAVVSDSVATQLGAFGTVVRLAGADRFATAAVISKARFASASVVYVATGLNFPDALAGSVAAARDGAPMLLVLTDTIPGPTVTELARLSPDEIVILGGTGVVSSTVETALGAYASTVTRLSGPDRFTTAAAVSQASFPAGWLGAFVATGENFPDALVGGAAGGHTPAPVLLVTRYRVPSSTAAEIGRLFGHPCLGADLKPPPTTTTTTKAPTTVAVSMFSFGYGPSPVTIKVGDAIRWTNTSGIQHTTTASSSWDSGNLGAGGSFSRTFDSAGTFSYFCTIHGAELMSGTVIVNP